ncbi:MAG: ABC transporter permease [Polyangiaceae bacterium]
MLWGAAMGPKLNKISSVLPRLQSLWTRLGFVGQIAVSAVLGAVLLLAVYVLLRRLRRRRGGRGVFLGLLGVDAVCFAVLAVWVALLPPQMGSVFVLSDQVVRVAAILTGTALIIGTLTFALPAVLNSIERGSFIRFVAARHVRAHKSGFLTVISILSIGGVAVSCASLCAVTSIMGGFGADLKRKILGNNAHVRIDNGQLGGFDGWREMLKVASTAPGVLGATPMATGEVMASSVSNTAGVLIRGIDTQSIGNVIDLLKNVEVGSFRYLDDTKRLASLPPDEPVGIGLRGEVYLKGPDYRSRIHGDAEPPQIYPGIVIGRELAKTLHVYVGDEITLVSPLGELGPMGLMPRSQRFRVAAVFFSGMYEYDATHAYVRLDVAQRFLDLDDRVTAIELRVRDAEAVRPVRDAVEARLGRPDVKVRDWKELNRNLFSALLLEKISTFIILSIAITVASFCIVCTLLLMVTEKSKEIAILKSLGASDRAIMRLFMVEGIVIGAIGTVFGVVTGWALANELKSSGVRLSPEVYYVDRLPIAVNYSDYAMVALAALVITTISTIYPALAASRLRPVDGLRYE